MNMKQTKRISIMFGGLLIMVFSGSIRQSLAEYKNNHPDYSISDESIFSVSCDNRDGKFRYIITETELLRSHFREEELERYDKPFYAKVRIISEEGSIHYDLEKKIETVRLFKAVIIDNLKQEFVKQGNEVVLYQQNMSQLNCKNNTIPLNIGDIGYVAGYYEEIKVPKRARDQLLYQSINAVIMFSQYISNY